MKPGLMAKETGGADDDAATNATEQLSFVTLAPDCVAFSQPVAEIELTHMTTSRFTPARRRSVRAAVMGIVFIGFVQLVRLLTGNVNGWLAWTTPFAFWGIAYFSYRRYLQCGNRNREET